MSVMHEKESIWFSSTMDLVEHWVNVVEQSLSSKSGGHHCFFFFFPFFFCRSLDSKLHFWISEHGHLLKNSIF